MRWAVKFGALFVSVRGAGRQKERGNKEKKKRKKEKSLGSLKEKKKINKRKKGDRKTASPYIFSSPKVEEKIPVKAGVRVCARTHFIFHTTFQ